jgi:haloacetate dehalogenase
MSEVKTGLSRREWLASAGGLALASGLARPGMAEQQEGSARSLSSRLFPNFEASDIQTSGATIRAIAGGQGPPVLLLHGAPQSHISWRGVAPRLAEDYTVVATDLRGYGDSSKPRGAADHSNYSKRAMALDQVEVMRHFGFDRFAVVGQDRGGRVTHRMLLDHPDTVTRAMVMDIVPAYYLYHHVDIRFIQAYFHWFQYVRPYPIPENALLEQYETRAASGRPVSEIQAEYRRVNQTPEGVHGMCEDYRASASIDLVHDEADLTVKVACPLRVLWAEGGAMDRLYDVLAIWKERGVDVDGRPMPGGHNMQEGAPDEVLAEIRTFLA